MYLGRLARAPVEDRKFVTLAGILEGRTGDSEGLFGGEEPSSLGQLSLLPSAGRDISTGQSAATLWGWGVKSGMARYTCG